MAIESLIDWLKKIEESNGRGIETATTTISDFKEIIKVINEIEENLPEYGVYLEMGTV